MYKVETKAVRFSNGMNLLLRKKPLIIGFSVIIMVIVIVMTLASLGYYPILVVNGAPVTARRFFMNNEAALRYAQNIAKTYPSRVSGAPQDPDEIGASVLTGLVEETLLNQGLQAEAGRDADMLVQEKIAKYGTDQKLQNATEALYGMTLAQFREEVLIPQAKQDVFKGRLFLKDKSLDEWISDAKKNARVVVLSAQFTWDGEKISAK